MSIEVTQEHRYADLFTGEAVFDVAPDPNRPFVVRGQGVAVHAVGTRFNVRMDESVDVTVIEGMVEVTAGGRDAPVSASAGKRISVRHGVIGSPEPVSADAAIAWTHGRLVFDQTPLGVAIAEIARYHDGRIFMLGDVGSRVTVSGTYFLEDPERILETLAQTLPIHLVRVTNRLCFVY